MVTKVKLQKFWYKNKCKSIRWVSEKARIHFSSRVFNTLFSLRHTLFFCYSPVLFIFSSNKTESPPNHTKFQVFDYLCYPWFRPYSQHNLTLVQFLVFFLVTLQHKVSILFILIVIQFPQQLLNRFHEATFKNYRSRGTY